MNKEKGKYIHLCYGCSIGLLIGVVITVVVSLPIGICAGIGLLLGVVGSTLYYEKSKIGKQ